MRNFFLTDGFTDVMTPPMVQNPGMETHIHPFQVYSPSKKKLQNSYLHTSPEFCMKELLTFEEFKNIFTISYVFRDEPSSDIHRSQFLMLEWYRKNERYEKIMDDVENLIKFCVDHFANLNYPSVLKIKEYKRITVSELFQKYLDMDILEYLDTKKLKEKIQSDFKDVPLPSVDCSWDDHFFLLFLNKIEPHFKTIPYLMITEFPAPLSALSTISKKDSRIAERFEVYIHGIELCNCFNELTDPKEQIRRFKLQAVDKSHIYDYTLPWPSHFLDSVEKGCPPSSGIALGIERLLKAITGTDNPFFY